MASFHDKIGWKMPRKRKIKIFLPFPSDRTGNRKFQKKIRKFKKIKKYHCGFSFQAKIGWKKRRKGENKNCLSIPFVLEGKYKITKKEKKIKKIQLWLHFMTK